MTNRSIRSRLLKLFVIGLLISGLTVVQAQDYGDKANIHHVSQEEIEQGNLTVADVIKAGEDLFKMEFNRLDGLNLRTGKFNRISGPDTQSCADCHFKPIIGGAGPNIANVFAVPSDANRIDITNPRNTNHLFGAGSLERLAMEMTYELLAIERDARAKAQKENHNITVSLITKSVSFGELTAHPDGTVDKSKVVGVDLNLTVKPFSRKGIVRTIRQFSLNACNLHFGLQAVEVVGENIDGDDDGVVNELTVGDITAMTVWQASLPIPVQKLPADKKGQEMVKQGERLFQQIGCTDCHRASLPLKNPLFRVPNPRVNSGKEFVFDLTKDAQAPRLTANKDGVFNVPLYSDVKRHDMGKELAEVQVQTGVPPAQFITTPLWGTGNTGPWLHDGRATTLHDAIVMHGGEATTVSSKYQALSDIEQRQIVEFLKSLVVVKE